MMAMPVPVVAVLICNFDGRAEGLRQSTRQAVSWEGGGTVLLVVGFGRNRVRIGHGGTSSS